MKIVIDIPKFVYDMTKAQKKVIDADVEIVGKAIANGTPLPKGHGRLIDADTYRKEMLDSREFDFFKRLDMQPTIIEADKEVENETISEN